MFVVVLKVCGLTKKIVELYILTNVMNITKTFIQVAKKTLIVCPDIVGDFTNIKQPDNSFWHVVFDPPHIKRNKFGEITKRYGNLEDGWQDMIRDGFKECFRVLKPNGTLIFKWSEVQFPVKDILKLTDEKPLYGHKSGKKMNTHWICFIKDENKGTQNPK